MSASLRLVRLRLIPFIADAHIYLCTAALYYDYCLTLAMEIERMWKSHGGFSWAISLFYVNRYLALFGHIPVIVQYFWVTPNPSNPNNKKLVCIFKLC